MILTTFHPVQLIDSVLITGELQGQNEGRYSTSCIRRRIVGLWKKKEVAKIQVSGFQFISHHEEIHELYYVNVINELIWLCSNSGPLIWIWFYHLVHWDSFQWHGLTLIPAWMSNYTHYEKVYEINYPFTDLNGCTVENCKWVSNFIPHFIMDLITYPSWDYS